MAAADSDGEMLRLRSACAEAQAAAKAAVAQLCNATAPLAQAEATARTAEHLSTVRAQRPFPAFFYLAEALKLMCGSGGG